jgi:hypothetical protein
VDARADGAERTEDDDDDTDDDDADRNDGTLKVLVVDDINGESVAMRRKSSRSISA